MPVLRFSISPRSEPSDPTAPWHLFAEPDALTDRCHLVGRVLDQVAGQMDPDHGDGGISPEPVTDQPVFATGSSTARYFDELTEADLGAPDQPVVVFVHGFQFEPRRTFASIDASDNPHQRLFHFDELPASGSQSSEEREHELHLTPWLKRAMSPDGNASEAAGLAVSFAYSSWGDASRDPTASTRQWLDGLLDFDTTLGGIRNFYALAYVDAGLAGHALAGILSQLARRLAEIGRSEQQIDIVAHSLGTRTALKAMEVLAARAPGGDPAFSRLGRVICLAGACLWVQAARALHTIETRGGGHAPEIYNILSSADGVVRMLGARASLEVARAEAGIEAGLLDRVLTFVFGGGTIGCEGLPDRDLYGDPQTDYQSWVDLNLNDRGVQRWARGLAEGAIELRGNLGFGRGDHWVHFTHRPNWDLYRQILWNRTDPRWTAAGLRAQL